MEKRRRVNPAILIRVCRFLNPMPFLEIWETTPAWQTASAAERARAHRELRELVTRNNNDDDSACGPFLRCRGGNCLLIWHVNENVGAALVPHYQRLLGKHYVRLLFGPAGTLRARDFMERLKNS
jgi:hypothetical protein